MNNYPKNYEECKNCEAFYEKKITTHFTNFHLRSDTKRSKQTASRTDISIDR